MIDLTKRQTQVLHLIAQGKIDKEIALELKISSNTVRGYITEIFNKLGVGNRTQAAKWAMENLPRNGVGSMKIHKYENIVELPRTFSWEKPLYEATIDYGKGKMVVYLTYYEIKYQELAIKLSELPDSDEMIEKLDELLSLAYSGGVQDSQSDCD